MEQLFHSNVILLSGKNHKILFNMPISKPDILYQNLAYILCLDNYTVWT